MADRYEKLKKIGEGSYGEVWQVKLKDDPPNTRTKFVLKVISLVKANPKEKQYAVQEAELLKTLNHPNIVSCKDTFWYDSRQSQLGIVMSYCENGDLYQLLKNRKGKGKLSENEIMEWFIQITLAVQYLHSKNVLHRDLKTQNVFLTRSNLIKVGDLGIARQLAENEMASTLIGTPYYMSPEIFKNIPYSYKSDIWSLGCILYEMTSLKHAFTAHEFNSLVHKIISGKPPPIPPGYSKPVGDLITRMLTSQVDERPSAKDILQTPFVQEKIKKFLEDSSKKHKRPTSSSSSRGSRQSSARASSAKQTAQDEVDGANANCFDKDNQDTIKSRKSSLDNSTLTPKKDEDAQKAAAPPIKPNVLPVNRTLPKRAESDRRFSPNDQTPMRSQEPPSRKLGDSTPLTSKELQGISKTRPSSSATKPKCSAAGSGPLLSNGKPTPRKSSEPVNRKTSVSSVSSVSSEGSVRSSKAREERRKKKEQEYAEKDRKVKEKANRRESNESKCELRVDSPEVRVKSAGSSDGHDSNSHSDLEITVVEKKNKETEQKASSVDDVVNVNPSKLSAEYRRQSSSSSTTSEAQEANADFDQFVNVLSETLRKEDVEVFHEENSSANVSANTLEPEMMQTITMSAKPADRIRVLERELESVFEPDIIHHCLQVIIKANPTDDEENTEEELTRILGKKMFEKYIGRFWHLMILSKTNGSIYAVPR